VSSSDPYVTRTGQSRVTNPYPKDPEYIEVGPLVNGMVRNKDSQSLDTGELLTMKNFHAEPSGPRRRPGSITFAGGTAVTYAPVRDLFALFKGDGSQRVGVLDSRFLYLKSGALFFRQGYTYSTGTMKTSGPLLVAVGGANFSTANILAGDYALLKPGASQQELQVASRLTKSVLQLASTPSPGPYAGGSAYKVYRAFNYAGNSRWVDYAVAPVSRTSGQPRLALADGRRPLWGWDGSTLTAWAASLTFIPLTVCYFQDRLFAGNIIEGGNTFRRRIRWSTTLDSTAFIASPDTQWIDRPYGDGELLKLLPLGKLLAVFYSDGMDIGRPSNIAGDVMPLSYEQLNTGGSGLVGMKAAVKFYDGIYCALEDGFYFLDSSGFVNVGEPIWKYATEAVANMQGTFVAVDWRNRCVVFGVPLDDGTNIGKLWIYNYETKKWSWDDVPCTMLGLYLEGQAPTWDTSAGSWDSQVAQWDTFSVNYRKKLAFGRSGQIALSDPTAKQDYDGTPVEAQYETGDMEFGLGNMVKTSFELVIDADRAMPQRTTFTVEATGDRGITWKQLGTAVFPQFADKAKVNFKFTGHMQRFRVTNSEKVAPFSLPGLSVRVRVRGRDVHYGR
jgi:hypothetical protein